MVEKIAVKYTDIPPSYYPTILTHFVFIFIALINFQGTIYFTCKYYSLSVSM